jgi:cysteine sulfinate desulfinase/cysteine desulfurase-like protein
MMTMQRIYLDYNASTPIDPAVAAAMTPFLSESYGNPSSGHWAAAPAKASIEGARGKIAALLGCHEDEVIFTSGGTEANNLALKGVYFARRESGDHIITTRVEHPAITEPCRLLERLGARITYLPVDSFGRIDPDDLVKAITLRTVLISIMHANNEVGTIQPIEECARIAREHGVLLHTDAAQSVGKIATDVNELGVDLLSIAGHKLYAPKGVGALFVRRGVRLEPLLHGAGHEGGAARWHRECVAGDRSRQGVRTGGGSPVDGSGLRLARLLLARASGAFRQSHRAQWTSCASAAEYAQCFLHRLRRRQTPGASRRRCRLDRFGVPCRAHRAIARP